MTQQKRSWLKFFGDIIDELKKAVWPTRRDITHLTIMVIVVSLVVALFLGVFDYGFTQLIEKLFLGGW